MKLWYIIIILLHKVVWEKGYKKYRHIVNVKNCYYLKVKQTFSEEIS